MDIFEYNDYRVFINDRLEAEGKAGARSRLAAAAHCSASWITRALSGHVQLTPDQVFGIGQYFHLSEKEIDYLLLLLEYERSASATFKNRIKLKLEDLKKKDRNFSSSVKVDSKISEANAAIYYSSWIFAAIHVACMIKHYSVEELCELFNLRLETVLKTLSSLREMGLLVNKAGKWSATNKLVHLPAEHPMASISHMCWRSFTMHCLQQNAESGLHYSAIHCLSKKDIERIRKKLKDMVLECRGVIEESPSEALAVFCLDWISI